MARVISHLTAIDFSTNVWVGGGPSVLDDVLTTDYCWLNNNIELLWGCSLNK